MLRAGDPWHSTLTAPAAPAARHGECGGTGTAADLAGDSSLQKELLQAVLPFLLEAKYEFPEVTTALL